MTEILRLSSEADEDAKTVIAGDDNHLFFQLADRLLITRKLTGNFPDYDRVLPKEHAQIATLRRDDNREAGRGERRSGAVVMPSSSS